MGRIRGAHHSGSYGVRAARVRRDAEADPRTRCWRCGLTLAESILAHPSRRVFWTAGHLIDGDVHSVLLAECSACNFDAGARRSDGPRRLANSRRWF